MGYCNLKKLKIDQIMQMGFERNVTWTYTKWKFLEKKKKKDQKLKWVFKEWHWDLPQGLDYPVSPLESGVRSLLPSFKFCVFLCKIFSVSIWSNKTAVYIGMEWMLRFSCSPERDWDKFGTSLIMSFPLWINIIFFFFSISSNWWSN